MINRSRDVGGALLMDFRLHFLFEKRSNKLVDFSYISICLNGGVNI